MRNLFSLLLVLATITVVAQTTIVRDRIIVGDSIRIGGVWYSNLDSLEADLTFDSDRSVLRVPSVGDNLGGSTLVDFVQWWYFAPPTITLSASSSNVREVGTDNVITLSGATNNPGGATLSGGELNRTNPSPDNLVVTLGGGGSATSYSVDINFNPRQGGSGDYQEFSYSFQTTQDWSGSGEFGSISSPTRTLTAVYPVLYGTSSTDWGTEGANHGSAPYTALNKLVETEGNKSVTLTGTNVFIYYLVPATWGDVNLSSIVDGNGFNVLPSFTSYNVTISSSGLDGNYSNVSYKLYKLQNLTNVNATYTFNR